MATVWTLALVLSSVFALLLIRKRSFLRYVSDYFISSLPGEGIGGACGVPRSVLYIIWWHALHHLHAL